MVTGKMHESWLEMLMGGDGEVIGTGVPVRTQWGDGSEQYLLIR